MQTPQNEKIFTDPNYIHCPKMKNSVTEFCNKHPDGVDNEYISRVLLVTPQEVEDIYQSAVQKIRSIIKV